jgi:hypothetical protein
MTTWYNPPALTTLTTPAVSLTASSFALALSTSVNRSRVMQWTTLFTFSLPPTPSNTPWAVFPKSFAIFILLKFIFTSRFPGPQFPKTGPLSPNGDRQGGPQRRRYSYCVREYSSSTLPVIVHVHKQVMPGIAPVTILRTVSTLFLRLSREMFVFWCFFDDFSHFFFRRFYCGGVPRLDCFTNGNYVAAGSQ